MSTKSPHSSLRPLAILTVALASAWFVTSARPVFASWSQVLSTPNGSTIQRAGSLNFNLVFTHSTASADDTIGIAVTGASGISADPAGPVTLNDTNSPVTVPMVLRATATAQLGTSVVTIHATEGASTVTTSWLINVVAGTSSAPIISAVSVTFTSTTITVSWNTDVAANSKIDYGTTTAYGQTVSTLSTYATTHRLTMSGLSSNTLYHFHISSCTSTNLCNNSDPDRSQQTAIASGDTTPPFITNILISASSNQATISWDTDENADSEVEWGTTVTYGAAGSPLQDPTLTRNHSLVMTGLSPTTTYYWVITSKDAAGNSSNSGRGDVTHFFVTVAPGQVDRIFTTGACTDPSTGNGIPIGQCTTSSPSQYCHSGGVLALDCTKCGYTCSGGQTCRADGTCADNPSPNAANPFLCNDASCYDANGTFITPAQATCFSSFPACNANTILKVRPDRICSQWLTPSTTVSLVDPQSHQKEELSLALTSCTALDSAGRCSQLVQGNHCEFDPLRICKTSSDCAGLGRCVPPAHCQLTTDPATNTLKACTTDFDCSSNGSDQCISDNLTYFSPNDRAKFAFLTGSINPGLTWGGGHCDNNTARACTTLTQTTDCGAGNTCVFDPSYGRCAPSAKVCSNNTTLSCAKDSDCGTGNTCVTSSEYSKACQTSSASSCAGGQCYVQAVSGKYPWDLNRQVGIALPQITNSEFEEIQKAEVNGRTVTEFPTKPWLAIHNASIRVVVDPTLIASTTAGSNHALQISPSAEADSGAVAPVGGFAVGPSQQYYLSLRLRSDGPQKVSVAFSPPNSSGGPDLTQGVVNTFDLSDTWSSKLISISTDSNQAPSTFSLFVTCLDTGSGCQTNAFYIDDVFIQTALNTAFNDPNPTIIPRSCRIYPQEDSLTCQYSLNGVLYQGQHGYCLQKDPDNNSICLSWWPVDIIAGDGNFFGGGGGYSDRTPLYLCLESRGTATTTGGTTGATGTAYLSPEVSNFKTFRVRFAGELCNLSTGTRTGSAFSQAGHTYDCPGSDGVSQCDAKCTDDGLLLGENAALTGTNDDAYKDDLQDIQVNSSTYAPGTYILSRENNWQFVACYGGTTSCPVTYDSVTGWSDTQIHDAYGPGVVIGAKADFSDSGLLTTITYKFADGTETGGTDAQTFSTKLHFKEICRVLAKVADGANTIPWAARVASRSYAVNALQYKYTQDFAPYGGAVVPEDPNNPSTWINALNAEQPVTDDPSFSAPQYQSRSGSPYACVGNCADRFCVGGKNNGTLCNSDPTICRAADSGGIQGVCQGVGPAVGQPTGSGANSLGFQIVVSNPDANSTFFAEQRARRLFAQSLGVFEWSAQCIGGTNAGSFCTANNQCNSKVCKSGYFDGNTGWTPPTSLCGTAANPNSALRNTFNPATDSDYCAIAPTVFNIKVNGGPSIQIGNGASVSLSFNFNADTEQVPVQHILVDWGDKKTVPLDKSLTPQTDPASPISFTHQYACSGPNPCSYTTRVLVIDNWGWGTNPGATSRSDSSNTSVANHTNWVQGPTVTVTPS